MTADELRERLAVLCDFVFEDGHWWHEGRMWFDHPFPPNDYNALIAAWPEGWVWGRCDCVSITEHGEWYGFREIDAIDYTRLVVPDTGDEYADRLRLTVAVLEATKT